VRCFAESGRGFWGFGGVFVWQSGWLLASRILANAPTVPA
jgi:hypothetical protein